jgi:hypothetical protein
VHAFSDQAEGAEQVVLSTSDRYADVVEYRYARSDVVSDASAGPPAGGAFPAGSHLDLTDRPSTDVDEAEHGRFRDRARLGGVQPQPRRSGVPTPWRTEAGEPREIQSGRRASVAVETEPDDHDEVPVDGAPVHDEIEVVGDDRAIDIGTEIEVVADRGEVELVADRGEVEVVADETSAPPRDAGDAGDARGAGDGGSALTAPQLSGMFARPPLENDPGGATPGHGHGSPAQRADGGRDR